MRTRSLHIVRLAGLVAGLAVPVTAGWAQKMALTVSPPVVEMVVAPGGDRSVQVTLTNDGDRAFEARAEVVDLVLDRAGSPLPMPAGTSPWSASRWVTLSDGRVSVRPNEQRTVRCRVRVPLGQTGGRYGAVLFTAERSAPLSGSGMRLETRTGTVLMLTAARTERRKAEVGDFQARRGEAGEAVFEVGLRNTGNVHLRASGDILIRNSTNRIVARLKLDGGTGTVLPDGVRTFAARMTRPVLQPGAYRAEVRFAARGLRAATAARGFEVTRQGEVIVQSAEGVDAGRAGYAGGAASRGAPSPQGAK